MTEEAIMLAMALAERYATNMHGVLSCFDRIIITGTLPGACYAAGMTSYLLHARNSGIRLPAICRAAARSHS
ncbi:MAG: hypothetical protein IPP03_15580 [Dechloromonas sp.]|nr:hypothetical protein [Candidatus Dechloromonas phosphoritropha]